jgi:hypothetical protein
MIDIITCFCDKDYNLIENFIKSINLSLDYKLIFVDDRLDKSLDLTSLFIGYDYYIPSQKLGTFEARRFGFNNSKNDYVWFVDIDDELIDFDFIDYGVDANIYNFSVNSEQETFYNNEILKGSIKEDIFNFGLWNKIFKRSTLRKAYDKLPFIKDLCFLDDTYLSKTFFLFSNEVRIDSQIIYNYKCKDRTKYLFKDNLEWVNYLLANCPNDLKDYFDKILHS